jgi:hypothetical protein
MIRGLRGFVGVAAAVVAMAAALPGVANAATATWTTMTVTGPAGSDYGDFYSVSCPTSSDCLGVGAQGSDNLSIEQWTGGSTWNPVTLPGTGNDVGGVSCATADACAAEVTGDGQLNEWWNGSKWQLENVPTFPSFPYGENVTSVSCATADSCVAVGQNIGEYWNGSTWAVADPVQPAGATWVQMSGISCPASNYCVAAGNWPDSNADGATEPLIEVWNGSTWSIQYDTVLPADESSYVEGVSCTSTSSCFATGGYSPTEDTNVATTMQYTGGAWTTPVETQPANATDALLKSVSCTTAGKADHCTAVGFFEAGSSKGHDALAEYYNGSSWAYRATASPSGKHTFNSVSCVQGGPCTAVGVVVPFGNGKGQYLAEQN